MIRNERLNQINLDIINTQMESKESKRYNRINNSKRSELVDKVKTTLHR
jgi:hypothetical protein